MRPPGERAAANDRIDKNASATGRLLAARHRENRENRSHRENRESRSHRKDREDRRHREGRRVLQAAALIAAAAEGLPRIASARASTSRTSSGPAPSGSAIATAPAARAAVTEVS